MATASAAKRHKASLDASTASARDTGGITRAYNPSQQVLSGELLQMVGQYLDIRSLLDAALTNSNFHAALTSDVAWQDSRWAPDRKTFNAVTTRHTRVREYSFFGRLRHMVIPDSESAIAMVSLPALPALRSLNTKRQLIAEQVELLPQLDSLILQSQGLNPKLLTALSQLATLRTLRFGDECRFESEVLRDHLALFKSTTAVHLHFRPDPCEMIADEFAPVLQALHYMQSAFLEHLDISFMEYLAEECSELLAARPADSRLVRLKLDLEALEEQNMTYGAAVKLLRAMYPKLQELILPDNLLDDAEMADVSADCREHHVTLTFLPYQDFDVDS